MIARRIVVAAVLLLPLACRTRVPSQPPVTATLQPAAVPFSEDAVWEASAETLRRHRFRLDRVDRRAGVITTLPENSQHFFEFWRKDVDTKRDRMEATINPMRRWVEVTLSDTPESAGTGLTVVVHKERLSAPDRQFNTSGAVYQFFGNTLPATTGSPTVTADDESWIDQGRDPAMEAYLLDRIRGRSASEQVASAPPAGEVKPSAQTLAP